MKLLVAFALLLAASSSVRAKDYNPIPPSWNRKVDLPGELSVGADYCTQMGKCTVVGDAALNTICINRPEADPCMSGRLKVQVLAVAPTGIAIVQLNGKNYAAGGGRTWTKRLPDGYTIGGPVSVFVSGRSVPLELFLQGKR